MIVPDDGDKAALTLLLGALGVDVTVRLFRNDYTPDRFSVADDFTEANFSGYAAIADGGWTAPALDANAVAFVVSPALVWSHSGGPTGNTVYGVYVTVSVGGQDRVIAAERLPVALPMSEAGHQVARQITYTSRRAA